MHRAKFGFFILAVAMVGGCGGGSASPSKVVAPVHGGNIVELPDSTGFVELKTENEGLAKGARKAHVKSRITAFFFQADGTTTMSPAPTDVKVTIGPAGSGTVANLTPQSTEPGKFASEPGDYPDALRGQIDLMHDGKPVQATFAFR